MKHDSQNSNSMHTFLLEDKHYEHILLETTYATMVNSINAVSGVEKGGQRYSVLASQACCRARSQRACSFDTKIQLSDYMSVIMRHQYSISNETSHTVQVCVPRRRAVNIVLPRGPF